MFRMSVYIIIPSVFFCDNEGFDFTAMKLCAQDVTHNINLYFSKQHTMPYRIAESTATIHILLPKRKYYTNRAKMVGVEKLLQKRLIKKVIKAKTGLTTRRLLYVN